MFERADAVEDIMTDARDPRIGLNARHECAMPRAGSASTRAESVFVDEELLTVDEELLTHYVIQLMIAVVGDLTAVCLVLGKP